MFSAGLCGQAAAERMTQHFAHLLSAAVAQPHTAASTLPLMDPAEQQLVMRGFNRTETPLPALCMHQFFERQAAAAPAAKCIIVGGSGGSLTYKQVNTRANQLAHRLNAAGVGVNVAVAVLSNKRPELYIALLAVLKAGGCYVPIDHTLPAARVAFILKQSAAKLLLAESTIATLQELPPIETLHIDKDWAQFAGQPISNPPTTCKQADAAYVLFTSGAMSTFVQRPACMQHAGRMCFISYNGLATLYQTRRVHRRSQGRQGAAHRDRQRNAHRQGGHTRPLLPP